jgi:hypothetical protein
MTRILHLWGNNPYIILIINSYYNKIANIIFIYDT